MKPALLLMIASALFFSCTKHDDSNNTTNDIASYWHCSPGDLDSATIVTRLQGSWKCTRVVSGATGEVTDVSGKNLIATFNADATYTVKLGDSLIYTGPWTLKKWEGVGLGYVLNDPTALNQPYGYLYGSVQFCDNKLAFIYGYLDGPDTYFERFDENHN